MAAIEEFAETEDCSPVELVASHPAVKEIASRFGKTPDEVSKDINKLYLESYKLLRRKRLHLLD
jgi:hypothetical protein